MSPVEFDIDHGIRVRLHLKMVPHLRLYTDIIVRWQFTDTHTYIFGILNIYKNVSITQPYRERLFVLPVREPCE